MTTPFETSADRVVVDVWSDVMCPFCYLGTTHLSHAAHRTEIPVDVRFHAFQLMPELPHDAAVNLLDLLQKERGIPRRQAAAMNASVAAQGAEAGLAFDLDAARATNTYRAHRLINLAKIEGLQPEMARRLFKAYFLEGADIGDVDVLADLAEQVGIDRRTAGEALGDGTHDDDDVEADLELARRIGIRGVPFFVIDGTTTVTGAQPVEVFASALSAAWAAHGHTPHTS